MKQEECFNPRSRKGNDDRFVIIDFDYDKFQSTFPQGERPVVSDPSTTRIGFNPRSRKGNDPSAR